MVLRATISHNTLILESIPATWTGSPAITVTATIKDVSIAPSGCDYGSAIDPDLILTWNLISIPGSIGNITIKPPSHDIGIDFILQPGSGGKDFLYKVKSSSGTNLKGLVVSEIIVGPKADFKMSHFESSFLSQHPTAMTPDDIAMLIIDEPESHSFTVDANNEFIDTHGGFALKSGFTPQVIMTGTAAASNKLRYFLEQEYIICSSLLKGKIDRKLFTNIYAPIVHPPNTVSLTKYH
jgi:hypothetical protein